MAGARTCTDAAVVPLPPVRGATVDPQTRCVHWSSPLDVVALRFWCCGVWYPCFACHEDEADHPARARPRSAWDEPSALCGVCGHVMTTPEYRAADGCPQCAAPFNPGCRAHAHLYFAD